MTDAEDRAWSPPAFQYAPSRLPPAGPIPAPLLDLVEVAPVGVERVVGFFGGPVVGHDGKTEKNWVRFRNTLNAARTLGWLQLLLFF